MTHHSFSWDTVYAPPIPFVINAHDTLWVAKQVYENYFYFTNKEIYRSTHSKDKLTVKDNFSLYLRQEDQLEMGVNGRRESFELEEHRGEEERCFQYLFADTAGNLLLDTLQFTVKPYMVDSLVVSDHVGGYLQYVFKQGLFKSIMGIRTDYWRLLRDHGFSPHLWDEL